MVKSVGNMDKEEVIEVQGVVTDALPNASFRVQLETGQEVLGFVSGKIRKNRIRILQGDKVIIAFSLYDLTKGRIIRRLN